MPRKGWITILVIFLILLSAFLSRWVGPLEVAWNHIDPPQRGEAPPCSPWPYCG